MNIRDDFILNSINEGYLVGGMVRDFFISELNNKEIHTCDRDIAIKGAENFARNLAFEFNATFITLDETNQIYRIVLPDKENYVDISELRGESIENDLTERDFTINAIAFDLKSEEFIDVTGGINDIQNGVIRAIKEKNFIDDPLRILRAFRFMATTGFELDENLIQIINANKFLLCLPAKERVQDEIMKLFGGKYTSKSLLKMYETGVLEIIFPCVSEMAKVPANTHHHLDLIHHVIETVRQIELEYESKDKNSEVIQHLNAVDFGGYPRINHLKLAGFLHDIGKFSTWTIEANGRHRFIKHDIVGAELVVPLLKNLKFSNKQIEYIQEMIRQHIYPSNIISHPRLDQKILMRYVRKMDNNVIDNIFIAKADRLSARGHAVTAEMIENNIQGLNYLLNFYLKVKPTLKPLPKLLDGNEIMEITGIKQSPELGNIIEQLHEAQLNEEVNTREDAIKFVKNFLFY